MYEYEWEVFFITVRERGKGLRPQEKKQEQLERRWINEFTEGENKETVFLVMCRDFQLLGF